MDGKGAATVVRHRSSLTSLRNRTRKTTRSSADLEDGVSVKPWSRAMSVQAGKGDLVQKRHDAPDSTIHYAHIHTTARYTICTPSYHKIESSPRLPRPQ